MYTCTTALLLAAVVLATVGLSSHSACAFGYDTAALARWAVEFSTCDSDGRPQSPIALDSLDDVNVANATLRLAATPAASARIALSNAASGGLVIGTVSRSAPVEVVAEPSSVFGLLALEQVALHRVAEHVLPGEAGAKPLELQLVLRRGSGAGAVVVVRQRIVADTALEAPGMAARSPRSLAEAVVARIIASATLLASLRSVSEPLVAHAAEHATAEGGAIPLVAGATLWMYGPGAVSFPPCEAAEWVIIVTEDITVSAAQLALLLTTSAGAESTARPPQPAPIGLAVSRWRLAGAPPTPPAHERGRDGGSTTASTTNARLRMAVIIMTAVVAALSLYIVLLLAARFGRVSVPTWLGGLHKHAPVWRNPPSAHLKPSQHLAESYGDNDDDSEFEEDGDSDGEGGREMGRIPADDGSEGDIAPSISESQSTA